MRKSRKNFKNCLSDKLKKIIRFWGHTASETPRPYGRGLLHALQSSRYRATLLSPPPSRAGNSRWIRKRFGGRVTTNSECAWLKVNVLALTAGNAQNLGLSGRMISAA